MSTFVEIDASLGPFFVASFVVVEYVLLFGIVIRIVDIEPIMKIRFFLLYNTQQNRILVVHMKVEKLMQHKYNFVVVLYNNKIIFSLY